jgi:hypothetical protein
MKFSILLVAILLVSVARLFALQQSIANASKIRDTEISRDAFAQAYKVFMHRDASAVIRASGVAKRKRGLKSLLVTREKCKSPALRCGGFSSRNANALNWPRPLQGIRNSAFPSCSCLLNPGSQGHGRKLEVLH